MRENIESARQKYKPNVIKFLLIAEAPPPPESKRFFYFPDVKIHDHLFLETMKAVYQCDDTKSIRRQKRKLLERFKNDGFYLIDASDESIKDKSQSGKEKQIRESLPALIEKVRSLVSEDTKIILISKTVYKVCFEELKLKGFNVINKCSIPFPCSGQQKRFREKLSSLLNEYGWQSSSNLT